jgi:hypothetical protein
MSLEQFDQHIRGMYEGESVVPPAGLEDAVFGQLNRMRWTQRAVVAVLMVSAVGAGYWGLANSQSEEVVEKTSIVQEAVAAPEESRADEAVAKPEVLEQVALPSTISTHAVSPPFTQPHVAQKMPSNSIEQLETLQTIPASSLGTGDLDSGNIQVKTEDHWVIPVVVKLKH